MKILSLNTWGGRAGKEGVLAFFQKHNNDVDVFCLQEIWSAPHRHLDGHLAGGVPIDHTHVMTEGMQEISHLLQDYNTFFHPHFGDNYGLMMLVRKKFQVVASGEVFVYKHKGYVPEGDLGNHGRNIQYTTFETEEGLRTIINFHGIWNGMGKDDSEDRLVQSANICRFLEKLGHPFVLCGDFNLKPDTQSVKKLEEAGLHNLISAYGITSTRTSLYTKPEKYANYIFTSNDIVVRDFQVLPDEVSDHAPLLVDVS